jgi:hypothetical protein
VTYLFSRPICAGEFGASFNLAVRETLPTPGGSPINFPEGKFCCHAPATTASWLHIKFVRTWAACITGTSPKISSSAPCHYSKYEQDGTYPRPAPRSADRLVIRLSMTRSRGSGHGRDGNPLQLPDEDLQVIVETGQLIRGKPKGVPYTTT